MLKRTIELLFPQEFLDTLTEYEVSTIDRRFTDAIGYLSNWGVGGRGVRVTIAGDRHGEMVATYWDKDGAAIMVIGAVPDENWVWSFHS